MYTIKFYPAGSRNENAYAEKVLEEIRGYLGRNPKVAEVKIATNVLRASMINNPVDMFAGMRNQGQVLKHIYDCARDGLVPVTVTRKSGRKVEVLRTKTAVSAYISK